MPSGTNLLMSRNGPILVTAFVVIALSILSGPLVGGVDLTSRPTTPAPGSGSASVSVQSVPTGTVHIERGEFDAGTYHLAAEPAVVRVSDVRGNPTLRYSVDIPALGLVDTKSYALGEQGAGTLRLEFRPFEISPEWIQKDRYNATIAIWLVQRGNEYESLYQESVTVEVER